MITTVHALKALETILTKEPNAVKAIHDAYFIDFCGPLYIFKKSGKFTVNQLLKEAAAAGYIPEDSTIIVCTTDIKYREDRIYTTQITTSRGDIDTDTRFYTYSNGRSIYTKIEYYFRKSDFNDYRKQDNIITYVICQRKANAARKNPHEVNYTSRFKVKNISYWGYSSGGPSYIGRIDLIRTDDNGTTTEYNDHGRVIWKGHTPEYTNITEIIDKSGYIVNTKRDELKRRAAALRAERAKAAYIKTDNAAIIAELENLYKKARAAIVKELSAAETVEQYQTISKKLDYFHGIADALAALERLKENDANRAYSSIEKFTAAADAIRAKFEALTA